jgi:hypothetical protein
MVISKVNNIYVTSIPSTRCYLIGALTLTGIDQRTLDELGTVYMIHILNIDKSFVSRTSIRCTCFVDLDMDNTSVLAIAESIWDDFPYMGLVRLRTRLQATTACFTSPHKCHRDSQLP